MNVIRYMLSRPLDFDPGTRYAYSNFGYCVLGRLIEKLSGVAYEKFVQEKVLAPAGIKRMRLGASLDGKQAPGEVRYYTRSNEMADNVFPDGPRKFLCLTAVFISRRWTRTAAGSPQRSIWPGSLPR